MTLVLSTPRFGLGASGRVVHVLRVWQRAESRYFGAAVALLALAVPTTVALTLDPRTFDDVSVWLKPLKFQLALALYVATLAFYARYLAPAFRATRSYRAVSWLVIFCILAEAVWVTLSAHLGKASHYDVSTPAMAVLYATMGLAAAILTSATAHQAWGIHHNRATGLSPLVKFGLVWGLGLTLPLTLVTAFTLSSGLGHHIVAPLTTGIRASDADGLLLFGWSREHGDLRAAHFLATHSMHVVPLLALAASRAGRRSVGWARTAAVGWTLVVATAFAAGLLAHPIL